MSTFPTVSEQADYVRHKSERHFTEERREGGMSEFVFPPGQQCFRSHKQPLDKQEIFSHEGGGLRRVHENPRDWTEDFNESTEKVRRELG
jgi:hypothetical protein